MCRMMRKLNGFRCRISCGVLTSLWG
jgi:hypothetical protein